MKKYIYILILAAVIAGMGICHTVAAKQTKADAGKMISLINEYKSEDGFEVFSLGSFSTGLFKTLIRSSASKEDKEMLDVVRGVRRMAVVEYTDASEHMKTEFTAKVKDLLKDAEKLMEMKTDGEAADIFCTPARSGESISDIIIYVPQNYTLVCVVGKISAKDLAKILEMSNE